MQTALAEYVKSADLTTTLANYVKTADLAAEHDAVEKELSGLVKAEDLQVRGRQALGVVNEFSLGKGSQLQDV